MSAGRASGAERLTRAIERARDAGSVALCPFLTAGFPSREGFPSLLERVASVSDALEVGVPFSDPMADGLTVQRASQAALANGVTLRWILDVLGASAVPATTPVVLMSYLNPLLALGERELAGAAAAAGVAGLVVPDLPFEECGPLRAELDARGIALVQLVTPATPDERLRRLCAESRGYVYAVTVTGTTGGGDPTGSVLPYLDRVAAASTLPVLAGFGIRRAEQVRAIGGHADGVIVGSALIERLEAGEDPLELLNGLRPGARPATEERS